MPSTKPDDPRTPRAELLARVVRRGEQLRLRRRIAAGGTLLGLLAVAVTIPALLAGGPKGRQLRVVAGQPTASTTGTTSTTVPTTTLATTVSPSTTTSRTPTPSTTKATIPPHPTTTTIGCTDSNRSACGPNAPMTVTVTAAPANPTAGQLVTFVVTASDPDAVIDPSACGTEHLFGDETSFPICTLQCILPNPGAAFRPTPSHIQLQFTHAYTNAGTYKASFTFISGNPCSGNPYASTGHADLNVAVT